MLLEPQPSNQYTLEYKPQFYRLLNTSDAEKLKETLERAPAIQIYDTMESQLSELAKINTPQKQLSPAEIKDFITGYIGDKNKGETGVWVYYPWSQKLVHLLGEEDFIKVRTNRNLYKITPKELSILRKKRIGIIGLSVGQSVALTIATERICGHMHLADFDAIELSNLNRLSNSNVCDLGLSKVIITARRIAELDPFIKVTCWQDGITINNIDAFLGDGASKIDILVEECDGLDVKILSRIKAKQKGIPVVMDTNDMGMLDIERFDLEPQRPILHGRVQELEALPVNELVNKLSNLTIEEKIGFLARIIGMENVSEEMKISLSEMRKTISAWPQLSSAVNLGGAMVSDTCRRIALGKLNTSGRFFIHFNKLIN